MRKWPQYVDFVRDIIDVLLNNDYGIRSEEKLKELLVQTHENFICLSEILDLVATSCNSKILGRND